MRGNISNMGAEVLALQEEELRKHDIVQIQVGERLYTTTRGTLTSESVYFRHLFADPETLDKKLFLDADPGMFEHVLRYLRHGTMPMFYDRAKGHGFARYRTLAVVSEFLGIAKLTSWLVEGRYVDLLRIRRSV